MILRLRRSKPGEQQAGKPNDKVKAPKMPSKNHRKGTTTTKKKSEEADETPGSPIPEDVINILLGRFFPEQEDLTPKKKTAILEQENLDRKLCTRNRQPEIKRAEYGEKGPKKGKRTKESSKVQERDGVVDPPSRPRHIVEDGPSTFFVEKEPEAVTLTFREHSFPAQEISVSKNRKPNIEQDESDYEDYSRLKKRKNPEGRKSEDGEKAKSKKSQKGKRTIESNKVHESDGAVDPPLEPMQRAKDGLIISIEENPEAVTPSFREHNYQGCRQIKNTELLKSPSPNLCKKRKGRGITTLTCITEDTSGVRRVLVCNAKGQPIGPDGKRFSSYLGVLGRRMVPIIHESWFKVPKELKETLLNHVEAKYVIDSKRRKKVISAIGVKWKSFKANLTKFFIYPFKDQPEVLRRPPEQYGFIKQEHWDAFVRIRLSEEFQVQSKRQAERRAKNIYDHRLGRKGYVGLVEKLKQSLGTSVDELDRCDLWKKAQQNEKGVYENDAVREKAELIDALIKQKEDGNLITQGDKDILTLALGTPEHSYRVRGVGPFVTRTADFHLPKRNYKKYVGELEQKVRQQADKILEMNQTLQAQCSEILQQAPPTIPSYETMSNNVDSRDHFTTPPVKSGQDGSECPNNDYSLHLNFETDYQSMENGDTRCDISPPDLNSFVKKSKQCRLAVNSKANIVARGLVFERVEPNEKIHNAPLRESNVRVAVEYAISPNALLPIPVIGEMTMVKDAIGSCVAWPKEFVLTGVEEEEDQAAKERSGPIEAFASFVDQTMPTSNTIIPMPNAIFEEEADAHLQKAHLMYLCDMQELTTSCMLTYIRHLCDNLISFQDTYGFVNPASISSASGPAASSIITKRLQTAKQDQLFFVPYNTRGCWTLIVIDSSTMDVHWLDSLQKRPPMDVKIYVTTGLKALQTDGKKRPNPTWHCIKCPKQSLDIQCGYYVMRYMRELMEDPSRPFAEKILQLGKSNTYSQDEVDEVRLELIDFILANM